MLTPDPGMLAAVDQQLASTGEGLDHMIGTARKHLNAGTDRTQVIAGIYAGFIMTCLTGGSPSEFMRGLAVAVVRLAEAGEQQ
jgi:hypothetical protein